MKVFKVGIFTSSTEKSNNYHQNNSIEDENECVMIAQSSLNPRNFT
jgi:hypothetical protein